MAKDKHSFHLSRWFILCLHRSRRHRRRTRNIFDFVLCYRKKSVSLQLITGLSPYNVQMDLTNMYKPTRHYTASTLTHCVKSQLAYLPLLILMLTSCIKDEPENMECDILEAWVEGDNLAQHFSQRSDMRISDLSSSTELLTFTVNGRATLPPLALYFKLTPGGHGKT